MNYEITKQIIDVIHLERKFRSYPSNIRNYKHIFRLCRFCSRRRRCSLRWRCKRLEKGQDIFSAFSIFFHLPNSAVFREYPAFGREGVGGFVVLERKVKHTKIVNHMGWVTSSNKVKMKHIPHPTGVNEFFFRFQN